MLLFVTLLPPTTALLWMIKYGKERKKGSLLYSMWKTVLGKFKISVVEIKFCPKYR